MLSKKILLQYLFIYMMIQTMRSCLFVWQHNNVIYFSLAVCVIVSIIYRRVRSQKLYLFFGILAATLMATRMVRGGYGLQYWMELVVPIWLSYIAYTLDKEKFLIHFVKEAVFFAATSLVFWGLSFISTDLVNALLLVDMPEVFKGTKGVLLYSFHYGSWESGYYRNCGIFTEPGIYQIILNTALFILLFFETFCKGLTPKQRNKYTVILTMTLLSAQSTTGYAGFAIILAGYFLSRKDKMKRKVLVIIGIIVGYLVIEYITTGENSILYTTVISKTVGESGSIDLSVDTGYYRMLSIESSWNIFIKHPFLGSGDNFSVLQYSFIGNSANAGGGIVKFMCVAGLISFIPIFYMYVVETKKRMKRWIPFMVHVFLWVNTGLAQAEIVYACIIMFAFVNFQYSAEPEALNVEKETYRWIKR